MDVASSSPAACAPWAPCAAGHAAAHVRARGCARAWRRRGSNNVAAAVAAATLLSQGRRAGSVLGEPAVALAGGAADTAPVHVRNARDPRLALYRWKTQRDPAEYEEQLRSLAARALRVAGAQLPPDLLKERPAPAAPARLRDLRRLRRRSGGAALGGIHALGCAVGVHHHLECLQGVSDALAMGRHLLVDSVLLSVGAPHELRALASSVSARVFEVDGALEKELLLGGAEHLEDESGAALGDVPCRFAVAYPIPCPLAEMRPPFVVLDGLGSAMNVGQLVRSAQLLGITSFVVSDASWAALNGRSARVSEGGLYNVDFHYAANLSKSVAQLKDLGVRTYVAEDYFDSPVAPHLPHGDRSWALVLGAEDRGVSAEVAKLCDAPVCVPQRRGASLNVAAAGALCLYELARHMA